MAKTTIRHCDRCGRRFNARDEYHGLALRVKGRWYDPNDQTNEYDRWVDLCGECKMVFVEFLTRGVARKGTRRTPRIPDAW